MEVVQPELEGRRLAFLADRLLHLGLDLLDDFFDARRVDAAVGDEALDGLPGDFAPERIEARKDDGARRVVDDELDAGGGFERADVAALAADDASLQVVARQVDHRDGGFDGVLGGAALDGVGDDLLRAHRGGFARFGFQALDEVGGVAPGVAFDLLEEQLARLVGAQAGDALQLAVPLGDVAGRRGCGRSRPRLRAAAMASLARADPFRARSHDGEAVGQGPGLVRRAPVRGWRFRRRRCADLLVGLGGDGVRFLARFERGFLAQCLGVALGLADQAVGFSLRARQRLVGHAAPRKKPPDARCGGRQDEDDREKGNVGDEVSDGRRNGRCTHVSHRPVYEALAEVSGGVPRGQREGSRKEWPPLCRVGRSDEPARAGGTAAQVALQASSCRGMHTTQRRDSLGVRTSAQTSLRTITRKAGNLNSWRSLLHTWPAGRNNRRRG